MRIFSNLTDLPNGTDMLLFNATTKQWEPGTIADFTTAAPDAAADFFTYVDATDGLHKKALISSIAGGSFTLSGDGGVDQNIAAGDTLNINGSDNFTFTGTATDIVQLGWTTGPTTGGTSQQVMIFDDNTDSYSWGDPIVIAAGSSTFLSYDNTNRELSVSQLLITDVTVDNTVTSLAAYVATVPTHEQGDVVILTNATGGTETYIVSGADGSAVGNYTQINDGSYITALTLAGDAGTPQSILDGNTITVAGGGAFTTTAGATDTITIDWSVGPTTGGATQQFLQFDDTGDTYSWVDIASLGGFTAAADTGVSEAVGSGDTLTFTGGAGIATVVSATDTVTFSMDVSGLTTTTPLAADEIMFFDVSATNAPVKTTLGSLSFTLGADTGVAETVALFDTVTIAGGDGLASVVSATDTVTLNLDTTNLTAMTEADFVYASDEVLVWDDSASDHKKTSLQELLLTNQYVAQTTAYTATAEDEIIEVTSTAGGAVTITLPAATGVSVGRRYSVLMPINAAAMPNDVTINGGGTNINTEAAITVNTAGAAVTVISNGSIWRITA